MRPVRFIALLIVVIAFSVMAQDTNTVQSYQPLTSIVKIEGQVCRASNYEEFQLLLSMVKTVNQLKKNRSEGKLTRDEYDSQVAVLLGSAKIKGVNVSQ